MNYTREQAEQVLRDVNKYNKRQKELYDDNIIFLNHKFPEQKSGWYRTKNYDKYLSYIDFENNKCYGFSLEGNWETGFSKECYSEVCDYLATPQEVERRLIEEAKRRGFVEGAVFKGVQGRLMQTPIKIGERFNLKANAQGVYCDDSYVFHSGKWAEIIEQPETELTRTIKKAEKIADKLEKLLSSQRS